MTDNTRFIIKSGDLSPSFRAQCKGYDPVTSTSQAVDLTVATGIRFLMRQRGTATAVVAAPMVKEDQTANAGWVHYDWVAGDTDLSGEYSAEVEVTWPGPKIQTFPANGYVTVTIMPDLG